MLFVYWEINDDLFWYEIRKTVFWWWHTVEFIQRHGMPVKQRKLKKKHENIDEVNKYKHIKQRKIQLMSTRFEGPSCPFTVVIVIWIFFSIEFIEFDSVYCCWYFFFASSQFNVRFACFARSLRFCVIKDVKWNFFKAIFSSP